MDTQYKAVYNQAASMQHKFHDYTHAVAYDPTAKVLRNQIHSLTNDIALGKSPRTIDNRLRTIQSQLRRAQIQSPGVMGQTGGPLLNNGQKLYFHNNFEKMRQNIISHPNF